MRALKLKQDTEIISIFTSIRIKLNKVTNSNLKFMK